MWCILRYVFLVIEKSSHTHLQLLWVIPQLEEYLRRRVRNNRNCIPQKTFASFYLIGRRNLREKIEIYNQFCFSNINRYRLTYLYKKLHSTNKPNIKITNLSQGDP